MNDSLYEDYMRGVLGYQGMNSYPNTYNMSYDNYERYDPYAVHTMSPIASNQPTTAMSNIQMQELENCYPQIYKIINPVVCEVCGKYRGEYTKESVDMLVNEVYKRISMNNEVNIKVQIDNRSQEKDANRNIAPCNCTGVNTLKSNGSVNCNKNNDESKRNTEEENNRQIRQNNNQFLNDLIRILLLNQILGGNFPRKAYTSANAS